MPVARGFALYVGLDELTAQSHNLSLADVVSRLKVELDGLIPGLAAETFAAVALAGEDVSGRNLDVVRTALGKPSKPSGSFVLDLSRKEVRVDGSVVDLTWRELELFRFFVLNSGVIVSTNEIGHILWPEDSDRVYQQESIKTALSRMWAKLACMRNGFYSVRGRGYVFHRSPELMVVNNEVKEKA
jgi:DNA-binding winged helix-turn-helix (wHTH) protein